MLSQVEKHGRFIGCNLDGFGDKIALPHLTARFFATPLDI